VRLLGTAEEKRTKMSKIVPPRIERLQEMGNPKAPKIGGISPKTVQVPPVEDLIMKMQDAVLEEKQNPPCCINCKCPPCRRGDCRNCYVSAARDTKAVKDYASMYRGVIYE
jgi:hypothetical protein